MISFLPESIHIINPIDADLKQKKDVSSIDKDNYIQRLEQEIHDLKSYQSELLKNSEISQDELQCIVEELQTTNEELETTKEELQSTNEELTIINDEVEKRNSELRTINEDLTNLLDSIDIPIFMVSYEGYIRHFTPIANKVFTMKPQRGRLISELFFPDFQIHIEKMITEVLKSNQGKTLEICHSNKQWYRLQITPYKTNNKVDGTVISMINIDRLKKALIRKRISLDYVNSVENTIDFPLIVLDENLHIRSANPAFYKMFNLKVGDKNTKIFFTHPGSKNKKLNIFPRILSKLFLSDKEKNEIQIQYTLSSNKKLLLLLNGQKIQWNNEDEPKSFLLSMQDITEKNKLEKSLNKYINKLEKSHRATDVFLAILSHELKTPLTSTLCWAQLLFKNENNSKEIIQGLTTIEQNSIIQGLLIDDLLNISKIKAGKMTLNISAIDPCSAILAAIKSVRVLAEKKLVVINTIFDPINGVALCDPLRLQQIIWNLLINSIKFSPYKSDINIHVKPAVINKKHLTLIEIRDCGKGIPLQFLPLLFSPYTQDEKNNPYQGGIGLGLAIAHDLLKLMGGTICAKNATTGSGAIFTITLPVIPPSQRNKRQNVSSELTNNDSYSCPDLHGLNILVVDDEYEAREVIKQLLTFSGAKVRTASSVTKALKILNNEEIDILVSDLTMPQEDGNSLIKKIRASKDKKLSTIYSIAISAHTTNAIINQALSSGFSSYLAKPFHAKELILCIANGRWGSTC